MFDDSTVMIKGAGDLASGIALRLWRCGFPVILTELPHPLAIRRTAAFADAVYSGQSAVEEALARCAGSTEEALSILRDGDIPLVVDPQGLFYQQIHPQIFIDATVSKYNQNVTITQAPLVIALGPGFEAGKDVHAVIETARGHTLGRVIWRGLAEADTGIPGQIAGISAQRVIHAPVDGTIQHIHKIGDIVQAGEIIAQIDQTPITATLNGMLRGLIHEKTPISAGLKIADIDPRANAAYCFTVSDKALAVAGGVLEAILTWKNRQQIA